MQRLRFVPLVVGALALGACDLTVPDYNNPSLEELSENPTVTGVQAAAVGLQMGARANIASYVSLMGIVGRESFNLDPADPRYVDEMVMGALDGGSGAFGGNLWVLRYRNLRNANILLDAVDRVSGFSATEKEAIRGYAKTIQALDLLLVINSRDRFGAVIDVDRELNAALAPIEDKTKVLAHVSNLLDEANAHLKAGGSVFPFRMSTGFTDFDTPVTFQEFNRALKARVEVYRGNYEAALAALEQSFVDRDAPLARGVYYTFTGGSGDLDNGLYDPNSKKIVVQPEIVSGAAKNTAGEIIDKRLLAKVKSVPEVTYKGVSSSYGFTIYNSLGAPIPVIRNEELLLLRAEVNWKLNRMDAALRDLNVVRERSGGLAPYTTTLAASAFQDALLYERRYSLLFEGGHRWIDMRRFGRLNQLPKVLAGAVVPDAFPIPDAEILARK